MNQRAHPGSGNSVLSLIGWRFRRKVFYVPIALPKGDVIFQDNLFFEPSMKTHQSSFWNKEIYIGNKDIVLSNPHLLLWRKLARKESGSFQDESGSSLFSPYLILLNSISMTTFSVYKYWIITFTSATNVMVYTNFPSIKKKVEANIPFFSPLEFHPSLPSVIQSRLWAHCHSVSVNHHSG